MQLGGADEANGDGEKEGEEGIDEGGPDYWERGWRGVVHKRHFVVFF